MDTRGLHLLAVNLLANGHMETSKGNTIAVKGEFAG
jgi:hypothetical protein